MNHGVGRPRAPVIMGQWRDPAIIARKPIFAGWCRAVGLTPRGLVDCMIAAVAVRHRATLLSHDVDVA